MNPRRLLCTMVAILVFGLASVAGSQPDQKDHNTGSAKEPAKSAQSRKQRQAPAQSRQRQPSAQDRQQHRAPSQDRQQYRAPAQDRQQRPAVQNRQQRQSPAQNRQQYRAPAQDRQQRPAVQNRQQRPVAPVRNRYTAPPRQAYQPPARPRTSVTRVEPRTVWPRYRAQSWRSQHRTWVQRGGYDGYRIPNRQFRLYFGRPHRFHLSTFQIRIVGAYPQFYSDGFWFTILDPVPEYWGNDWYDTDYVTIVESEDGYYLLNESYPDALVAVSVQLR
jgi:hypothetical protein